MKADWYFDVISPYAYLQFERLPRLPGDIEINYRPILLAALLNHWGQLGPAEIAPKRLFTLRHVKWLAARHGVALNMPKMHPFNPLKFLRLAVLVGNDYGALGKIFQFVWRDGGDLDSAEDWRHLCQSVNLASADVTDDDVKIKLRQNTEAAIATGVFGVPTFVAEDKVIWGNDATDMLVEFSRDSGWFDRDDIRRLEELPKGATRKNK